MKKSSNNLCQKYKEIIVDIVLFGSYVKNKLNPNDIDIAVIIKNRKESELLSLMKKFSVFFNKKVHLNLLLCETMLFNPLFKTMLKEGISLIDNLPLYKKLGLDSGSIFSFRLINLVKSKKVLFYYALHGKKNQKGLLDKMNGRMLDRTAFFIPISFVDEFQSFLESWKIDFYRMDALIG